MMALAIRRPSSFARGFLIQCRTEECDGEDDPCDDEEQDEPDVETLVHGARGGDGSEAAGLVPA